MVGIGRIESAPSQCACRAARCWCRPGRCRPSDLISGGVQYIVAGYSMSEFDVGADPLSTPRLEFHPAPCRLETSCAQEKLDEWGTDTRTVPVRVQGRGRRVGADVVPAGAHDSLPDQGSVLPTGGCGLPIWIMMWS